MVTILSIDGGGIRGLLPARVLQEIRFRLEKRGERRAYSELFNLVAGTSTGALIALAITGLFLVRGKKGITGRGAWLTVLGILIPMIYLLIYFY